MDLAWKSHKISFIYMEIFVLSPPNVTSESFNHSLKFSISEIEENDKCSPHIFFLKRNISFN